MLILSRSLGFFPLDESGSAAIPMSIWILVFGFWIRMIYGAQKMKKLRGEYLYIRRCFGPFAGFMFGWAQLFIIRTSPAAGLAIGAADYVGGVRNRRNVARCDETMTPPSRLSHRYIVVR